MTADSDPAFVAKAVPPRYRYAGAWIRCAALIIDGFVLAAVLIGPAAVVDAVSPACASRFLDQTGWSAGAVVYGVTSVVMLGWYAGWQAAIGATPGMLLLKLRVRGPDGVGKPSLVAAGIRNALTILGNPGPISGDTTGDHVLSLVGFVVYLVIGITIAESPTRQGIHDRLAGGTYVVRRARIKRKSSAPAPS